jgi:hypothetical protein
MWTAIDVLDNVYARSIKWGEEVAVRVLGYEYQSDRGRRSAS